MIRVETDHDSRAEELEQQAQARNYKMIHAIISKDFGSNVAEKYTKHIMENYPYETMTLSQISCLADDFHICIQCEEVTETEFMHDGEWDDDLCEWCYGNGR